MRLKLFKAASMPEAIARVRSEMGADALILATKRVANGVEITAAVEPEKSEPSPPGSETALQYTAFRRGSNLPGWLLPRCRWRRR